MRILDEAELAQVAGGCFRKYVPVCRPKAPLNGTMNGTNGTTNGCYVAQKRTRCAPAPAYSRCRPVFYKKVVCRPVVKNGCAVT